MNNDADTRHIQAILRYKKLVTTWIYTKVTIMPLQKVHARTRLPDKPRKKAGTAHPDNTAPDQAERLNRYTTLPSN